MYDPLLNNLPIKPSNPVNWAHPLNRGRVGWWRTVGNPGWRGGATLRDLVRGSGHSPNDGVLTGGATWRGGGRPGGQGCIQLDGATGYVDVPRTTALEPANVTVAMWVNPFANPTAGNLIMAFEKGTAGGESYTLFQDSSPSWFFTCTTGQVGSTFAVSNGEWVQLAGTFDGTNANLYVNGVLNGSAAGTLTYTSPLDLLIGAEQGPSNFFNGIIDDTSVWNRALSAGEINALYLLSKQGYPGMLNRMPLDWMPLIIIEDDAVLTNTVRTEW